MLNKVKLLVVASLLAITTVPAAMACPGHAKKKEQPKEQPAQQTKTVAFRVEGMHCAGCGDHVKSALAKQDGVVKVDVKVADKRVVVDYDSAKLNPEKIAKIISDLGYTAAAEV